MNEQATPSAGAAWRVLPLLSTLVMSTWPFVRILLPFVPIVVVWHLVSEANLYPPYIFPSPASVAQAAVDGIASGTLIRHALSSLNTLVIAFGLGALVGVPLAIGMGRNKYVAAYFDPIVNLLQAIPALAWIPLAILWFGIGHTTQLFLVFTATLYPLLFNTLAGVRAADPIMIAAARTQGASAWQVVLYVIVPATLPSLITGARLGFGYGFRALIGAEIIIGTAGLGYLIFQARQYLDTATVVLGMLTIGTMWIITDRLLLKPLERRTVERWGTLT